MTKESRAIPSGRAADASHSSPSVSTKGGIPIAGKPWTQDMAIDLCRIVERIAPQFGAHVALTGGLLYKDGHRKDCDILFYRIRQIDRIDHEGLFDALAAEGIQKTGGFGWCHKAEWHRLPIDFFFPEETSDGDYDGFDAEAHEIDMSFEELPQ